MKKKFEKLVLFINYHYFCHQKLLNNNTTRGTIMALKMLSAKDFYVRLKATIQASGRLGFTETTAKKLELNTEKWVKFAEDEDTEEMYLAVCNEKSDDAFPVKASSGYFYVFAKNLFDAKGLDYTHHTIIFDLTMASDYNEFFGGSTYKMNKRVINRKKKGEVESEEGDLDFGEGD